MVEERRIKVFLPYRGEFGFICMMHAPQVKAYHGLKAVFIEPGMEALYPDCGYMYVPVRPDRLRRARIEKAWLDRLVKGSKLALDEGVVHEFVEPDPKAPREYFTPVPFTSPSNDVPSVIDVVVCPRKREYGEDKNWMHWMELVEVLVKNNLSTFAVGHPDTSFRLEGCRTAWDKGMGERYLDTTIAAMLRAKLVVATDNGLAHLALMCGRPLALISHGEGYVADGVDDVGTPYWKIKLDRYKQENHLGAPVFVIHNCWHTPLPAIEFVIRHFEKVSVI